MVESQEIETFFKALAISADLTRERNLRSLALRPND
eukprot:CAMPEP_0169297012 /NCGR_PEP_ID=MMETSP1016-20121227/65471_1 /TAXON_ID=342587 /ORGANISM="Karlodinium micrum, Strain CCMP2283" /LENGTH=35 /DNA_ID= /DNA_START= /DNA_END= /DNA_ORIENTATION=